MRKIIVSKEHLGFYGDIPYWKISCPECTTFYEKRFDKVFDWVDNHVMHHVMDGLAEIIKVKA